MKKIYLTGIVAILLLGACGEGESPSNDEDVNLSDMDAQEIREEAVSFADGEAYDGLSYFDGILAGVIEVDVKFREVTKLDEMDATEEKITSVLDDAKSKIANVKKAMNLYNDKDWPKRAELHDLTLEWFDVVEGLMDDYLYDLAEPMSRADDTWSEEEINFYEEYVAAYDNYVDVDNRWVDYQYVYAAANNFEIKEFVDEEALIEEEISNNNHENY